MNRDPVAHLSIEELVGFILEDLPDDFVAPLLADVRPDRVPEVIGEDPRVVGQLFDKLAIDVDRAVRDP